jgi:hypothetical protein
VPLLPGWSAVRRPVPAVPAGPPRPQPHRPGVRLCFAADVERFRRFTGPEAQRAQGRFVGVLAEARRGAGITDDAVTLQHAGDGEFAIMAPGLDESVVLPAFVTHLRAALREVNADLTEHARLRLRMAVHRGHLAPSAGGWAGGAATAVHRLLDSDVLRTALADTPSADLALLVSDVLYQDVVAHGYGGLDAGAFTRVLAAIPAKEFAEPAWLHLTG